MHRIIIGFFGGDADDDDHLAARPDVQRRSRFVARKLFYVAGYVFLSHDLRSASAFGFYWKVLESKR